MASESNVATRRRDQAIRVFRTAGGEARLRILESLAVGSCSVGNLVRKHGIRHQQTMSLNLASLKAAGLVEGRRDGSRVVYRATDLGLAVMELVGRLT